MPEKKATAATGAIDKSAKKATQAVQQAGNTLIDVLNNARKFGNGMADDAMSMLNRSRRKRFGPFRKNSMEHVDKTVPQIVNSSHPVYARDTTVESSR